MEIDRASGRVRVRFRYNGIAYKRSLKTADRQEAAAVVGRIEETIRLLERGRLEMPPNADPGTFIFSDGKRVSKVVAPRIRTLEALFTAYRDSLPVGAKEESTLVAENRHMKHLTRHLRPTSIVQTITLSQMQQYVRHRSNDQWRRKVIGPETIKKELTTFRFIWNWGVQHGHLTGSAPIKGIHLPKTDEKPSFMTWDEISESVGRGGLTADAERELWDCLFLRIDEIEALLTHVESTARHPFIHPMFVIVAHTGARRSEILRSEIEDFDFRTRTVRLREKKKSRTKNITFRRVPMTALLVAVMTRWLQDHPGGRLTFPRSVSPLASQSPGAETTPMGGDLAAHYFEIALAGSKWEKVRGFHVFRHSFASNSAAAGVDQRVIDEWMGHQTDEMRRRYRHLYPEQNRRAIDSVFGRDGQ